MLTDMADRRKRFTIEVYPEEEPILRKLRVIGYELDIPVRKFVIEAIRDKLAALDAAEKGKKR